MGHKRKCHVMWDIQHMLKNTGLSIEESQRWLL